MGFGMINFSRAIAGIVIGGTLLTGVARAHFAGGEGAGNNPISLTNDYAIGSHGVAASAAETLADRWQVHDVGFGTKPSFDFDANGALHVMGITESMSNGVVWYAKADSVDGPWNPQVISRGYFYGPGDLRVDPTGTANIAWHNHEDKDPNHETIDPQGNRKHFRINTPGHNGWDNALALDRNGKLYMSAVNPYAPNTDPTEFDGNPSLEVGSFDGTKWTYEPVPGSGRFKYGLNTSIAIDSDLQPHVVFCKCDDFGTPGDLKYAVKDATGWKVSTVSTGGIRGRFPVLALDNADRPHAAWIDIDSNDKTQTHGFVRYGVLDNGKWQIETIDTLDHIELGFSGARKLVSLELDSQGRARVAYGDRQVLKYAERDENAKWNRTTVLQSDKDLYNGQVVLRLDAVDDAPAIAFWQPDNAQGGVVRLVSPVFPAIEPGDANGDGEFNQLDLLQVLRRGKFLSGEAATWQDGDWDGAPGGRLARPPSGNGAFDNGDLLAALRAGFWLKGPYGDGASAAQTSDVAAALGGAASGNDYATMLGEAARAAVSPTDGLRTFNTPEPDTLALFVLGGVALLLCRMSQHLRRGGVLSPCVSPPVEPSGNSPDRGPVMRRGRSSCIR